MPESFPLDCDLTPRDFHGRLTRGGRKAHPHRARLALALAAAVAVPAFAAPQEWQGSLDAFSIGDAQGAEAAPMPFEQAGSSFPGSAFYYLAPDAATTTSARLDDGAHWDNEERAGPAAQALPSAGTALDRERALTCLTQAIYYEAASEPDAGQRAVAQVVLNRVAHPAYPKTVCGVVYQGSERHTGCQFTFTCDGALARVPNRMFWERARSVARAALAGYVFGPVGLATHYHTVAVHPYWADSLAFLGTIGAHRFYRFQGPAGAPAAFRVAAYRGGEPVAAPGIRSAGNAPANAIVDPVAIEQAFMRAGSGEAVAPIAAAAVRALPTPNYSAALQARGGDSLYTAKALPGAATGSGSVRPEYANSGRWIGP